MRHHAAPASAGRGMRRTAPVHGVSMIEIAVVLVIVAILFTQAAPSFSTWIHNTQVRTATEGISNAMQLARAEAMRRNRSVMFWLTSAANPQAADWLVGCANPPNNAAATPEAPGDCPGVPTAGGVPANVPPINWIRRQSAADQQTPWPQVTATPAGATVVTFNSLGMVTTNADGTPSIAQVDVADPAVPVARARPLRVTVAGGSVRMCDPYFAAGTDPRAC
jgi:type IV fimbrial biogenesis protein FimT